MQTLKGKARRMGDPSRVVVLAYSLSKSSGSKCRRSILLNTDQSLKEIPKPQKLSEPRPLAYFWVSYATVSRVVKGFELDLTDTS